MKVQLTRRTGGGSVLRCQRADGSVTWQKQDRHAEFFALHDLTHFAVESTLGFQNGFFGLIAQGWDIEDTTGKGVRGRLPPEAVLVEQLVGLLGYDRSSELLADAGDFNAQAASIASAHGRPAPRPLSEEELARVRSKRGELFEQWQALAPGSSLELRWGH
ncbi:MAG: hypothetical protein JO307_23790 [Bryobacterales bacterium]|nr:hypothetical protein [Bryobacterales bacterium]